jgi:hypothetical protein
MCVAFFVSLPHCMIVLLICCTQQHTLLESTSAQLQHQLGFVKHIHSEQQSVRKSHELIASGMQEMHKSQTRALTQIQTMARAHSKLGAMQHKLHRGQGKVLWFLWLWL